MMELTGLTYFGFQNYKHKPKLIEAIIWYQTIWIDSSPKFQTVIWTDFYNIRIKTIKFSQKNQKKIHSDNMNGEWRHQRERKSFMECT